MTKTRILYSSADIHAEIKRLFGEPGARERRVALVAYVGSDGESYLPHPKGLRLICSPSPGGTDPDTLRRLMTRKADVAFSDKLHMKVYWSSTRGCLIASANASSNALGVSGLKEAGVALPPGAVDIDKLIRYASPRPVKRGELQSLDRLAGRHTKSIGRRAGERKEPVNFLDWYASPQRSRWKIAPFNERIPGNPKAVTEQSLSEYGHKKPRTWVSAKQGRFIENEWVLTYLEAKRGAQLPGWMYADFIVKVGSKERRFYDRGCPYYVVQVNPPTRYPLPPFKITPAFRRALNKAVEQYPAKQVIGAKSNLVPSRLLDLIAEDMKAK